MEAEEEITFIEEKKCDETEEEEISRRRKRRRLLSTATVIRRQRGPSAAGNGWVDKLFTAFLASNFFLTNILAVF